MAFFGLTTLGTQSPFQAALIENLGLQLFSEEELRESFDKFDKDGSHNLDITEMEAFLTDVYHGPPPAAEVKRVMGIFDSNKDGKVSWDEFRITVKRMKSECCGHQLTTDRWRLAPARCHVLLWRPTDVRPGMRCMVWPPLSACCVLLAQMIASARLRKRRNPHPPVSSRRPPRSGKPCDDTSAPRAIRSLSLLSQ